MPDDVAHLTSCPRAGTPQARCLRRFFKPIIPFWITSQPRTMPSWRATALRASAEQRPQKSKEGRQPANATPLMRPCSCLPPTSQWYAPAYASSPRHTAAEAYMRFSLELASSSLRNSMELACSATCSVVEGARKKQSVGNGCFTIGALNSNEGHTRAGFARGRAAKTA